MALSVLAILPIKPLKDEGIFRRRLAPGMYEQSGTGEAFHLELSNLSVRASLTTDRKKMMLDLTLSDGERIETIVTVVARHHHGRPLVFHLPMLWQAARLSHRTGQQACLQH